MGLLTTMSDYARRPRPAGRALHTAVALALLLVAALPVQAAELVMVETRGCPWCLIWHREIGPAYPKTPAGVRAPLRTIDLARVKDSGIALAAPVLATPTFLILDDAHREIGRITGYPGADFFWGLLDAELAKLPPGRVSQPWPVGGS